MGGAGVRSLALCEVAGVCSTTSGDDEQTVAYDSLGPRGEAGLGHKVGNHQCLDSLKNFGTA